MNDSASYTQVTGKLDLIDRQAAIDAVIDRYYKYGRFSKLEELVWSIEKLPSAEPERKRGKWIHDNPNTFRCSECNKYLDISCGNMKMNFCPNCEADMRGDSE